MVNIKQAMRGLGSVRYPSKNPADIGRGVATNHEASYSIALDRFLADLPLSVLTPFVRQRLWIPDLTSGTNTFPLSEESSVTTFDLFDVPQKESLILTYVTQTWLQSDDPPTPLPPAVPADVNTVYSALPLTAGASGVAPLSITVNKNPIVDVSGAYNDANFASTFPWVPPSEGVIVSGFVEQQRNILDFGDHRTAVIITENQNVGALYSATYNTAVNAIERPDAILIVCKGFLAPTQVIRKARKNYGI
jgi:hypothetical protein